MRSGFFASQSPVNARTMAHVQLRKKRVSAPGTQVQKGASLPPLSAWIRGAREGVIPRATDKRAPIS